MALQNFGSGLNAAVFGAGGGIGSAFVAALRNDPSVARVNAISRAGGEGGLRCDSADEADVERVAATLAAEGSLHLVIIATGILHADGIAPEKTWRHIDPASMAQVLSANTIAPALIAKHTLPLLAKGRKSVFAALSARVGSIGDNRLGGWVSYRASKAALNQIIRTLSIELARVNPEALILGLHPGTVDTALSEPFRSNVSGPQLFSPDDSVARMLAAIDAASPGDSGWQIAYDGSRIEP